MFAQHPLWRRLKLDCGLEVTLSLSLSLSSPGIGGVRGGRLPVRRDAQEWRRCGDDARLPRLQPPAEPQQHGLPTCQLPEALLVPAHARTSTHHAKYLAGARLFLCFLALDRRRHTVGFFPGLECRLSVFLSGNFLFLYLLDRLFRSSVRNAGLKGVQRPYRSWSTLETFLRKDWRISGGEGGEVVGGFGRMQPQNEPPPHAKQAATAGSREAAGPAAEHANTLYNILYCLLIVPIDCVINHHGIGSLCKCFMLFLCETRVKLKKKVHTTGVSCCPDGSHDIVHHLM